MKILTRESKDKKNAASRINRRKLRQRMIEIYGGKCACCGENKYEFLAIDHIDGGGRKQVRLLGGSNESMYIWIRKNNYPPGFRVLCHNCNMSLGLYGYCPHRN